MIKIEKSEVSIKETSEGQFPFIDMGSETHGRKSFRLWVSKKLIKEEQDGLFVLFPSPATLRKTEKGSYVLKPSDNHTTFNVFIKCGYRGGSSIEVLSPHETCLDYSIFSSPRGSCGISSGALITIKNEDIPLKVRWTRSGRLYGGPGQGLSILHQDGREDELDELPNGLEAVEELRRELE